MSEESLIVKLKGDTADLDKKLSNTDKSLNQVDKSTSAVDASLKTMSDTSRAAVSSISALTEKSKSLNTSITKLNSKLLDSREATKKAAESVDKLGKELEQAKESGSATAEEINALEKSLSKARSELVSNKKTTNDLNGELKEAKADYSALQTEIKATTKDLGKLDKESKSSSLSVKSAGEGLLKLSKAAIAVGTALTTMITLTAKGEQELQALSRQAKLATGDFEALAFATKQYGINAEQVADISKDISDKLGEFASTGTGAFQDFADVTGKTTEEAQALAAEWQNLSSQQVIQEIANQLEDAGASANETTFVFESLGNDLSKLAPLFADNGKELEQLTKRYNDVNSALSITQQEAKGLTDAATSFDLLTESIGNGTKLISAQLAPALDEFFNSVIDVVPEATQAILDFINSFKDTENISNEQSLTNQIEDQKNAIKGLQGQIVANQNVIDNYYGNTDKYVEKQRLLNEELKQEQKELEGIEAQLKKVQEEKEKEPKEPKDPKKISSTINPSGGNELQKLIDSLKTQEQIRGEQYARDLELAAGQTELLKEIEKRYLEDVRAMREEARLADLEADQAAFESMNELREQSLEKVRQAKKTEQDLEVGNARAIISISRSLAGENDKSTKAVFLASQALSLSEVFFSTQAASMRALAELGPIAGAPVAAAIETNGYLRMAAVAAASLGSISGGGSSGGSIGGTSSASAPEAPQEAPTLEAQNNDADGSNQTVTIKFDDSTELGVAFNNAIERSRQDGLI